jgi:threonine aldolase
MIAVENTQNKMGGKRIAAINFLRLGVPLSLEYLKEVSELAKSHGLKLHMDGARVFNAATALNVPISEIGLKFGLRL